MTEPSMEREMRQPEDASFDPGGRDGMVDLRGILLALRARLGLIVAVTLIAAVAAIAFVFLVTPRFSSEAQLLLENRDTGFTRTLTERELPSGVIDEQAVLSQVQVVTSREVAREVIRRLELVGNAEFDPLVGPMDPVTRVRTMLGFAGGDYDGREEDRIFSAYYRALTVFAVPRSRVLAIEFRSADPDLAARAANTIAEVYLEQLEEAQAELARAASSWLGANIEDLRARVTEAEAAVETFRTSSRLFLSGDSANISSQQLSDLNTRLADARSSQADAEARAQLISEMIAEGRAFEIPDVANNQLIGRLIEQRIDLRSRIALEQRTLLPGHPRILELRAQLADLDEQITASAERTVRILENDARIAASRVSSLEAALDAQMSVVAQANESEVQLRALEREARAEREQLENYLTRYREAVARGTQNATLPDARIVSRAVVPSDPVFPRKAPTIVLATLGAAFVAAGGVVVVALVSGTAPAAPIGTGGYGHPMHRRDDFAEAYGSGYGNVYGYAAANAYGMHSYGAHPYGVPANGYAPMDMRAQAAMSGQATDVYAGYRAQRQAMPAHPGEPLYAESAAPAHAAFDEADLRDVDVMSPPRGPKPDLAPEILPDGLPEILPVDEAQRPVPGRRAMSMERKAELPFQPAEEGNVLTGVRKLGARLRGTISPAATEAGAAMSHSPSVTRDRIEAAIARSRREEPLEEREAPQPVADAPLTDEPAEASSEAETLETEPERIIADQTEKPAKAMPETWHDLLDEAPAREAPVRASTEISSAEASAEESHEAVGEAIDEANLSHVAAHAPETPVPETPAPAATELAEPKPEDDATTVRHEPRLRRKRAARKASADPVAPQEEANPEPPQEATVAQEPASEPEPVPVFDDGPVAEASVPVPVRASGEADETPTRKAAQPPAQTGDAWTAQYDFGALLTRLRENQRPDHGQRVLVSGLGDRERLRQFGEALAQAGARAGRCILITMQEDGGKAALPGLNDLITERASFFDVIQRDPHSSLHHVARGRGGEAALLDDSDGLDVALTAFQHTYGLVFMLMPDPSDTPLLQRLARAADTIVIAADRESDDPELVDLYARFAETGPADVVVAGVGRRAGVAAA
jgi:uncharacterized protein involved in exopolysaccharide biosynthesis